MGTVVSHQVSKNCSSVVTMATITQVRGTYTDMAFTSSAVMSAVMSERWTWKSVCFRLSLVTQTGPLMSLQTVKKTKYKHDMYVATERSEEEEVCSTDIT